MTDGGVISVSGGSAGGKFREGLLRELERLIVKYNHGSGNSIRVEQAEKIFHSMMYCVAFYLQRCSDPEAVLRDTPGEEVFRMALGEVRAEVEHAKELYREVLRTRIPTDLPVYCEMLRDALPGFFQLYNPEFAAHETPALMVYPLLHEPPSEPGGVQYLCAYLRELIEENRLCEKYSRNHIRAVLFLYGREYQLDYHDLVVNLPEILAEADTEKEKKMK